MTALPSHISLENVLQWLLGLFLFLLPWQTIWMYQETFVGDSKWELATLGYYATELFLWATVVVFLVWFWKKKREDIFGSRMHFSWTADRVYAGACALFVVYALVSSAWAVNPDIAWQHGLRLLLAFALFFMLFIGPLSGKKAMWWFVGGAAVQGALGIWQFVTQSTIDSSVLGLAAHTAWEAGTSVVSSDSIGRWLRAYGAFPHPNILGGYMVIGIMCLTWLSNHTHVYHSKNIGQAILKIVAFSLVFDILIIALIVTFSRGAWIAFAFFMIGLLIGSIRKKYKYLARLSVYMMVFTAIFLFIFSPIVATRISGDSIQEQRSISERIDGYAQAWSIMQEHPWRGVGVGGYTAFLREKDSATPGWQLQPVHNTPLLLFAEIGIIGALLYLGVLVTFIRYQRQSIKRDRRIVLRQPYALAYIFYTILFLLLIAFDHYWYSTYIGLMMVMVFWALVFRTIREEDEVLC